MPSNTLSSPAIAPLFQIFSFLLPVCPPLDLKTASSFMLPLPAPFLPPVGHVLWSSFPLPIFPLGPQLCRVKFRVPGPQPSLPCPLLSPVCSFLLDLPHLTELLCPRLIFSLTYVPLRKLMQLPSSRGKTLGSADQTVVPLCCLLKAHLPIRPPPSLYHLPKSVLEEPSLP